MSNGMITRRSLALSLLGLGGLALAPVRALAQNRQGTPGGPEMIPMTPVQGPQDPFTESVAEMVARDEKLTQEILAGTKPSRESMAMYHDRAELEERVEAAMRASLRPGFGRPIVPLSGTPYLGPIDGDGHFVAPNKRDSGDLVNPRPRGPQTLGTGFAGPSLQTMATSFGFYNIPPDTQGAVGPNHIVVMCNGIVQMFNRTGTLLSSVTLNSFASVTIAATAYPRNGAFDPRVIYDRRTGKWFATIMEFGATFAVNNGVILAVSRTSDPTGTWDKYFVNFGVAAALTDYSTLGIDANGVYMAATIFPNAGGSSVTMAAAPIASLLYDASTNPTPSLGTVSMTTGMSGFFGTPHPAHNIDNSAAASRAWIVGATTSTGGGLRYRQVTWVGSTPTISAANLTLTIGGAVDYPLSFSPSGSTLPLDTGDFRIMAAVIRNNRLYASRTVGCNSTGTSVFGSGTTRCACEWFEVNVSAATATAVQSGRVFDAGATPRNYFYPSVAVSGQGHMAMTMSGATTAEFVGTYTTGRLSSDANGTMQSILLTQAGLDSYTAQLSGADNRFGDYSFTMVDPNDDQSIWGFQEYAATRGSATNSGTANGNWQIRVQKLLAPAPTASATTVNVIAGQTNVSLPITGTGLFDPGVGFTNRLAATVSGTGVSNVRISYISGTSASVRFDVSNTAASGTRNVTITNPDGQSVTLTGAINVKASSPAAISVTRTIVNTGSVWRVTFTLKNTGGSNATSVRVLASTLGSTGTTTTLPITVGTITAGGTANVNLDYPLAAATAGVSVISRVSGDHTGGTYSSSVRITP